MKSKLLFGVLMSLFIASCNQTKKLSESDFAWIPYKGKERLVFRSNSGDMDTIFLLKKDTLLSYPNAQSVVEADYEMVSVLCKHRDPTQEIHPRYLESNFLEIRKTKESTSEMNVLLSAKNAKFYSLSSVNLDSLSITKPNNFKGRFHEYNDVYILPGEDYLGSLRNRSNFVTKIYWSKSSGLVRYDKGDTTFWELLNKS
jgi:hypothetical protein